MPHASLNPPGRAHPARRLDAVVRCVARVFAVDSRSILGARRGAAAVARARHLVMYLAHVVLGYSLSEVAAALGRDRTAVAHGCRMIEDLRDDPAFEALVLALEAAAAEGARR